MTYKVVRRNGKVVAWGPMQGAFDPVVLEGDQVTEDPTPPIDPLMQLRAEADGIVSAYLDAVAQSWGYDSMLSAVSYADESSVMHYATQGVQLRKWRSRVWERCEQIQRDVQASGIVPKTAEFLSMLPPAPDPV